MQLCSTAHKHEYPLLRQFVRATTFAGLFAFLVCLGALVCTSAQAGTEPPPVAESAAESQEATSEGEDESGVASSLPLAGDRGISLSSPQHTRFDSDGQRGTFRRLVHAFASSATFAAIVSLFSSAPPPHSFVSVVDADPRPCLAQIFLAPVRPRGPTVLA